MRDRIPPPPNRVSAAAAEAQAIDRHAREQWRQRDHQMRQFCIEQAVKSSPNGTAPAYLVDQQASKDGPITVTKVEFATVAMAKAMYQFLTVPIKDLMIDET